MLQRMAEQIEYSECLDKANLAEHPGLKLAFVMAFAMAPLSSSMKRTKKPFNPLFGETFELVNDKKGFRFISEQVSHHPPISACLSESKNYHYWSNNIVKTKFWGTSIQI